LETRKLVMDYHMGPAPEGWAYQVEGTATLGTEFKEDDVIALFTLVQHQVFEEGLRND
jgi:hypothetical protein